MPKRGSGLGEGFESSLEADQTLLFEAAIDMPSGEPGFDFRTFEESEAAAARDAFEQQDTSEEPTEQPPERRATVRRSYLPPGDVVVDARPVGNMTVVTMRGRISESFQGAELGRSLSGVVIFDLSEVDRVTSFGVKGWLQMLDTSRMTSAYYVQCSEAIVNQITMMRNFCGQGRIHSVLAPYLCASCGEEFGAVYEAVKDREALLGRSPSSVACPACGEAAHMEDDPWAYFALDEHLLDDVPADLEQVLDHLTSSSRVDPIEKFISDDETRIRFNAPLDDKLRMSRAFMGLEGRVTIDLSVTPSATPSGIQQLVAAARALEPEVTAVWLDGASPEVVKAFIAASVPRVYVATMFVLARCPARGIQRSVLVDVERGRPGLEVGQLPPIHANWAVGTVELADAELLFQAARRLAPPSAAQPAPAEARPAALPELAPVARQAPAPLSQNNLVLQAAVLAAVLSLGGATLVFLGAFVAFTQFGPTEPVIQAVEPVRVEDQRVDGWDGGKPLPPPWVEQAFAIDGEAVLIVGLAEGTQVDDVAEASRVAAVERLVSELRSRVAASPAADALREPAPDLADGVAAARFLEQVGAWATPERVNASIKRDGDRLTVATQHRLPRSRYDQLVAHYEQALSFRGLTVGRRFPTDFGVGPGETTPLVVVRAESWFTDARAGAGVVSVGGQPVSDPAQFESVARSLFDALSPGGQLAVQIYREGESVDLMFSKQATAAPRTSRPLELLPLEGP